MPKIERILAREVLDSRGNPTIEAEVHLKGFITGTAIVPSGASTGKYEALEMRDGGKRYQGAGVKNAIANVTGIIAKEIRGKEYRSQEALDKALIALDGTPDKSKLGGNALLSVSLAFARASASSQRKHLTQYIHAILPKAKMCMPVPYSNLVNGGKHAGGKLRFQEFMVVPYGAKSFAEATQATAETYHALKDRIIKKFGVSAANVGDEGGFAPPIDRPEEALTLLEETIASLGYAKKVGLAMDPAASEFFKDGKYDVGFKKFSPAEMIDYYAQLARSFPIVSIEDPFDQDDFASFAALTEKIGHKIQIVGDDLLTTNVSRIEEAIRKKACVALLLKVNQIGTLTEALDAAKMSMDAKWNVMVSHRSGDSDDSFIADLAVGIGCGQIKLGAPCRGERCAKFNQLLRIEDTLQIPFWKKRKK